MKALEPISVTEMFPLLSREMLTVLRGLHPSDWAQPTICTPWTVKDVAAHLLGGNLGRLWKRERTEPASEKSTLGFDEILKLINHSNELWVQAAKRISPEILIEFLQLTDDRLYDHFKGLAQDELADITVAWASDELPPNWFDMAREYTEKWLHQQHIREALRVELLTTPPWLSPVLDTFIRGLPRTFRNVAAATGTSISVVLTGDAGGTWSLVKGNSGWQLLVGYNPQAVCRVEIGQDIAWRLFTKGIGADLAKQQARIEGNAALGELVFETVSIMA